RLYEKELAGVLRVAVHLPGARDAMKTPEVLQAVARIDEEVRRHPKLTASISLADLVSATNQAFPGGDPAERRVPSARNLMPQCLSMVDPADRADLVTDDYSTSHIAILLEDSGSEDARAFRAHVQQAIDRSGLAALGVTATLTGQGVATYREVDAVVHEI